MAFVPETFILYPEKLNFASDKAAYTYMKRYIFSLYICITGCLAAMATQRFAPLSFPKRETRAVWLTTFSSLDWPKNKATSPAGIKAQQDELCRILDRLKEVNINTVLLQTRVRGSVIYPSAIEPWDGCLTGTPGRAPGYAVLRKNGKTQWNSTGFPHKNGFSTLSPVFSTGFSRRKLAFSRFFLEFSAKDVEKCVESVENCPFFPRKRGVFRCPAAEERKALPQGESCRPAAMPGTGPEEVRCQRSRSRPPPSCRRTAHSPWWRGGRHPRQTPPSSSGS